MNERSILTDITMVSLLVFFLLVLVFSVPVVGWMLQKWNCYWEMGPCKQVLDHPEQEENDYVPTQGSGVCLWSVPSCLYSLADCSTIVT